MGRAAACAFMVLTVWACHDARSSAPDAASHDAADALAEERWTGLDARRRAGAAGGEGEGGAGGQPGPYTPNYLECFAVVTCTNGVVRSYRTTQTGLDESCPFTEVGRCEQPCLAESKHALTCPMDICPEHAPKKVGDPCTQDQDCTPTRSTWTVGGLTQIYLRCDVNQKQCVQRTPTVVPDWMRRCDPTLLTHTESFGGVIKDPSCGGGLCVFDRSPQTCIAQGCTAPCRHDGECPEGAGCIWPDAEQPTTCADPASPVGHCMPEKSGDYLKLGCW